MKEPIYTRDISEYLFALAYMIEAEAARFEALSELDQSENDDSQRRAQLLSDKAKDVREMASRLYSMKAKLPHEPRGSWQEASEYLASSTLSIRDVPMEHVLVVTQYWQGMFAQFAEGKGAGDL